MILCKRYFWGEEIISDLQKSWKGSKVNYHAPFTQCPWMSTSYITMVHLLKLRDWYSFRMISSRLYLEFTSFLQWCPFSIQGCHFALRCHVSLISLLYDSFLVFLCLSQSWQFWGVQPRYFVNCAAIWIFLIFFF